MARRLALGDRVLWMGGAIRRPVGTGTITRITAHQIEVLLTGRLGRRDSNLCISKSDLLNFIPPQRNLGIDRARP